MTEDTTRPEDTDDPVRKALKKLPAVKAAPDFDARLERRLAQADRPEERRGVWQILFSPGRIPAFGYSLAALVAVGYLSYYLFLRMGAAPAPVEERIDSPPTADHVTLPPVPVIKGKEETQLETGTRKSGTAPMSGPVAGKKDAAKTGAGKPDGGKTERNMSKRSESQAAPVPPDSRTKAAPQTNDRSRASEADQVIAPQSNQAMAPAKPNAAVQESVSRDLKTNAFEPPEFSRARRLALPSPTAPAGRYNMQSSGVMTTAAFDSAAIRDSLRLDSIKRAERALRDSLRKSKARKPGDL